MKNQLRSEILKLASGVGNTDELLYIAETIGAFLCDNDIGIFSLPEIELLCLDSICEVNVNITSDIEDSDKVLFLVTEAYLTGGHTRLMERLASVLPNKADLLISKDVSKKVILRIENIFDNVIIVNECDYFKKIITLVNILVNYPKVILFIHPNDICSVIAVNLAKKYNKLIVYFVNHSDHTFTFGTLIADYWLEVSAFGRMIDQLYRPELTAKRSFLGIPIDIPHAFKPCEKVSVNQVSTIMTAASGYKFKPCYNMDIKPLILEILHRLPNSTLYMVGLKVSSHSRWWLSKLTYFKRFKIVKSMPYDEYKKLSEVTDVYIDSHPMPGGTAFVEQYFLGKYCIGLNSKWVGYTPLEMVKFESCEEIFEKRLINNSIDENVLLERVISVHSIDNVSQRFTDVIYRDIVHLNLLDEYTDFSKNDEVGYRDKLYNFSLDIVGLMFKYKEFRKFIFKNSNNKNLYLGIFKYLKKNKAS